MFDFSAYINLKCGETTDTAIRIREERHEEVTAVFVDAACAPGRDSERWIDGEKGVCVDIKPRNPIIRYMADYRFNPWWCEPFFGNTLSEIPKQTQALILEKEDGSFLVLLPVVNSEYKCVFEGKDEEAFTARLYSLCDDLFDCNGLAFVYACGEKPNLLMEKCAKTALHLLNSGIRSREERRYPEVLEYLGWCSWDAMQIRVNEKGMLEKCEEFKAKSVPVKWVMLDDMWADVRTFHQFSYGCEDEMFNLMWVSPLYDYEADPERFPGGLKGCIEKIKDYGMRVGVWLPNAGYWRGIDPNGEACKKLKDYLIATKDGILVADWHEDKSYLYYKTIHQFLKNCGTDFVKIDRQSSVEIDYKGSAPIGRVAREYHNGMEASVGLHFDHAMINCMGLGSEDFWSRPASPVSRCSGDFLPDNREWFATHILQCAYNSILNGQLYWCDWDMWWTDDAQAKKNSLMRAISGGPIYISDQIGRSNREVLEPLLLSDGRILRCDRPCMPTSDCVTVNCRKENAVLKLQNMCGQHGILAAINIHHENKPVSAYICAEDIDGFQADEYTVYEHFSRSVKILKKGERFSVTLENNEEYRLYIFAPIKDGFAAIGRTDKFISPATIQRVQDERIILKECGEYAYVKNGELIIKNDAGE